MYFFQYIPNTTVVDVGKNGGWVTGLGWSVCVCGGAVRACSSG